MAQRELPGPIEELTSISFRNKPNGRNNGISSTSETPADRLNLHSPKVAANVSRIAAAELAQDLIDVGDEGTGLWLPLRHPNSIRLVRLFRDPISCLLGFELSEHQLSNVPKYIALSYVWGRVGNVSVIENEKGHRALRRNLNAFLNTLCNRILAGEYDASTFFWVDALCINQESLLEKGNQVQQIGQTFGQAEKVIAWLGTHQDKGQGCLDNVFGSTTASWRRLSLHDYWTRVWIIQEFVLAKEVLLMDEKMTVPVQQLQSRISNIPGDDEIRNGKDGDVISTKPSFRRSLMGRIILMRHVEKTVRVPMNGEASTLVDLVKEFKDQSCTDIKDKVYALLSLSRPQQRPEPVYTISVGSLFWKVLCSTQIERFIEEMNSLMETFELQIVNLVPLGLFDPSYTLRPAFNINTDEWHRQHDDLVTFSIKDREIVKITSVAFSSPNSVELLNSHPVNWRQNLQMFVGSVEKNDLLLALDRSYLFLILRDEEFAPEETYRAVGIGCTSGIGCPSNRQIKESKSLPVLQTCVESGLLPKHLTVQRNDRGVPRAISVTVTDAMALFLVLACDFEKDGHLLMRCLFNLQLDTFI